MIFLLNAMCFHVAILRLQQWYLAIWGCAILIKKSLQCKLTPIDTISKRMVVVIYKYENISIMFISIYMTCDMYQLIDG